jgi:hypothetical protein
MKIELFFSPGCKQCDAARAGLKSTAEKTLADVSWAWAWAEHNVLEHLDYAVELGILTLPAIAIDGELVFTSLPTASELAAELSQRARRQRP